MACNCTMKARDIQRALDLISGLHQDISPHRVEVAAARSGS